MPSGPPTSTVVVTAEGRFRERPAALPSASRQHLTPVTPAGAGQRACPRLELLLFRQPSWEQCLIASRLDAPDGLKRARMTTRTCVRYARSQESKSMR